MASPGRKALKSKQYGPKRSEVKAVLPKKSSGSRNALRRRQKPSILGRVQRDRRIRLLTNSNVIKEDDSTEVDMTIERVVEECLDAETKCDEAYVKEGGSKTTRRAYASSVMDAIRNADVIIEVLDCRDPMGYRSIELEDRIDKMGKKLILLLNKCDLATDTAIIDQWVKYLRRYYPCLAFRSMTSERRSSRSSLDFTPHEVSTCPTKLLQSGYTPIGARQLMGLLSNYARRDGSDLAQDLKVRNHPVEAEEMRDDIAMRDESQSKLPSYKNIVVAVIGMPNVGKSSVINSLCRHSSKARTGNEAGVTKCVSRIKLSEHIQLLDTPGVIMTGNEDDPLSVLRGCVKNYSDEVAERAVALLFATPALIPQIAKLYTLDLKESSLPDQSAILSMIAKRKGFVKKKGYRDLSAAARLLIDDWRRGRLVAICEPPVCDPAVGVAIIAQTKAPALDLNNL